jgi:hypothetical protein
MTLSVSINCHRYSDFSFSALSCAALAQPYIASKAIHIALQRLRQWDNIVSAITQEHKRILEIGVGIILMRDPAR